MITEIGKVLLYRKVLLDNSCSEADTHHRSINAERMIGIADCAIFEMIGQCSDRGEICRFRRRRIAGYTMQQRELAHMTRAKASEIAQQQKMPQGVEAAE